MKTAYGTLFKLFSLFLILTFTCEQIAFAASDLKPFQLSAEGKKVHLSYKIPASAASIEDSYQASGPKTIFLLQDAHTNESGQLNLARTLDVLLKNEKELHYVFAEAAVGDNSLSFLRSAKPLEERQRLARLYIRKGLLPGAEYLDLTSEHEFKIWGVEKPELYLQSIEHYRSAAQDRERFELYLKKIRASYHTLASRLLSPAFKALLDRSEAFDAGTLPLTDYFEGMSGQASKFNVSLDGFPSLALLKDLKTRESRIDFPKANEEEARAIAKLSTEDRRLLSEVSMKADASTFSGGMEDPRQGYFSALEEKLAGHLADYPELFEYFDYLKAARGIEAPRVLSEIQELEQALVEGMAVSSDEKTFAGISRMIRLYEKLFHLTLTPSDYAEYGALKTRFNIERLTGFLNKKIMDLGTYYDRSLFLESGYEEIVKSCETFYELTHERDLNFVREMTHKMDETGQTKAALVAGGFHTANLKALLKEKGISYVSFTPQVLRETNHARYENILLGQLLLQAPAPVIRSSAATLGIVGTMTRVNGGISGIRKPELSGEFPEQLRAPTPTRGNIGRVTPRRAATTVSRPVTASATPASDERRRRGARLAAELQSITIGLGNFVADTGVEVQTRVKISGNEYLAAFTVPRRDIHIALGAASKISMLLKRRYERNPLSDSQKILWDVEEQLIKEKLINGQDFRPGMPVLGWELQRLARKGTAGTRLSPRNLAIAARAAAVGIGVPAVVAFLPDQTERPHTQVSQEQTEPVATVSLAREIKEGEDLYIRLASGSELEGQRLTLVLINYANTGPPLEQLSGTVQNGILVVRDLPTLAGGTELYVVLTGEDPDDEKSYFNIVEITDPQGNILYTSGARLTKIAKPNFLDRLQAFLRFGTSGLRDLLENLTDLEIYINTQGFLLSEEIAGRLEAGETVELAGDLRGSTPRIMVAVAKAIADYRLIDGTEAGLKVDNIGFVPTPAAAYYGLSRKRKTIVVTGSHIPDDRNGVKFYRSDGEVLKADEKGIYDAVAVVRQKEYAQAEHPLFDRNAMFKDPSAAEQVLGPVNSEAAREFAARYSVFGKPFIGKKIVVYQHSSVARDLLAEIFSALGAQVVPVYRTDEFVPIDTENITAAHRAFLKKISEEHPDAFATISADGDGDRPIVVDRNGEFHRGDVLGLLTAKYLNVDFAAVPVTASTAVDKVLSQMGIRHKKTKVGSPYLLVEMNAALAAGEKIVIGWEVNGGLLLGSDIEINGRILKSLPTRDIFLPIIVALLTAVEGRKTVSEVFAELPQKYTEAGLVTEFPTEQSNAILAALTPALEQGGVAVDLSDDSVLRVLDDEGNILSSHDRNTPLAVQVRAIEARLRASFPAEAGLGRIVSMNFIDGVQIYFENGDRTHLRASQNAPEFRVYSESAESQKRADQLVKHGIDDDGILRHLQRSLGARLAVTGVQESVVSVKPDAGDSLWDIAEKSAGEGASNQQIADIMNQMIAQNPQIVDPNVIHTDVTYTFDAGQAISQVAQNLGFVPQQAAPAAQTAGDAAAQAAAQAAAEAAKEGGGQVADTGGNSLLDMLGSFDWAGFTHQIAPYVPWVAVGLLAIAAAVVGFFWWKNRKTGSVITLSKVQQRYDERRAQTTKRPFQQEGKVPAYRIQTGRYEDIPKAISSQLIPAHQELLRDSGQDYAGGLIILRTKTDGSGAVVPDFYLVDPADKDNYDLEASLTELTAVAPQAVSDLRGQSGMDELIEKPGLLIVVGKSEPVWMIDGADLGFQDDQELIFEASWGPVQKTAGTKIFFVLENDRIKRPILASGLGRPAGYKRVPIRRSPEEELRGARVLFDKLTTPLEAPDEQTAWNFLGGGSEQSGYGVPSGSAVHGSFALKGEQGYFVPGGKRRFLKDIRTLQKLFERRRSREGLARVSKQGIGGQHTGFEAIARAFASIKRTLLEWFFNAPKSVEVTGEYELGEDYEALGDAFAEESGADWSEFVDIISSKSGTTDETMLIFAFKLWIKLKRISQKLGVQDPAAFAWMVLGVFHEVNLDEKGEERPTAELFKVDPERFSGVKDLIELVDFRAKENEIKIRRQGLHSLLDPKEGSLIAESDVTKIFKAVLGGMVFESTSDESQSRLAAFIKNSGLKKRLGNDAPILIEMFDNVGGRWTAPELHMMTFLALYNLDAGAYWEARNRAVRSARSIALDTKHSSTGKNIGDYILNNGIKHVALIVPDDLFWFGKSIEQNFNESIWQKHGFPKIVAIKASHWDKQKHNYADKPDRLVLRLDPSVSERTVLPKKIDGLTVLNLPLGGFKSRQEAAMTLGELYGTFFAVTTTVGNRLIDRALAAEGYTVDDVDLNGLEKPATKILRRNLYVLQFFVELGKKIVETFFKRLQAEEKANPGAIQRDLESRIARAKERALQSNIDGIVDGNIVDVDVLASAIGRAVQHAKNNNRTFVPLLYLEGKKFQALRERLTELGYEWVLQGTGDQHISLNQILENPEKYTLFIVSFLPEKTLPGLPFIGFAKSYLNMISPHHLRDAFAEAIYEVVTKQLADQGGKAVFLRMEDSEASLKDFASAGSRPQKKVSAAAFGDSIHAWHRLMESIIRSGDGPAPTVTIAFDRGASGTIVKEYPMPTEHDVAFYLLLQVYRDLATYGAERVLINSEPELFDEMLQRFDEKPTGASDAYGFQGMKDYLTIVNEKPFEIKRAPMSEINALSREKSRRGIISWDVVEEGAFIAIDIGGSDIKGVVLKDGKIIAEHIETWSPREIHDPMAPNGQITRLRNLVETLRGKAGLEQMPPIAISINVGVKGDRATGVGFSPLVQGLSSPVHKEMIISLAQNFSEHYGVPTAIVNDGVAGAIWASVTMRKPNVLFLSLGTGLAAGYVGRDGRATDYLTEMGNLVLFPDDTVGHSVTDVKGAAQQYVSQRSVLRIAAAQGIQFKDSMKDADRLVEVQNLFAENDPRAVRAFQEAGEYLAQFIAEASRALEIDNVILAGRVTKDEIGEGEHVRHTGSGSFMIESAQKYLILHHPQLSHVTISFPQEPKPLLPGDPADGKLRGDRLKELLQAVGAGYFMAQKSAPELYTPSLRVQEALIDVIGKGNDKVFEDVINEESHITGRPPYEVQEGIIGRLQDPPDYDDGWHMADIPRGPPADMLFIGGAGEASTTLAQTIAESILFMPFWKRKLLVRKLYGAINSGPFDDGGHTWEARMGVYDSPEWPYDVAALVGDDAGLLTRLTADPVKIYVLDINEDFRINAVLNLNTADKAMLIRVFDDKTADKILEARQARGVFGSVEDVKDLIPDHLYRALVKNGILHLEGSNQASVFDYMRGRLAAAQKRIDLGIMKKPDDWVYFAANMLRLAILVDENFVETGIIKLVNGKWQNLMKLAFLVDSDVLQRGDMQVHHKNGLGKLYEALSIAAGHVSNVTEDDTTLAAVLEAAAFKVTSDDGKEEAAVLFGPENPDSPESGDMIIREVQVQSGGEIIAVKLQSEDSQRLSLGGSLTLNLAGQEIVFSRSDDGALIVSLRGKTLRFTEDDEIFEAKTLLSIDGKEAAIEDNGDWNDFSAIGAHVKSRRAVEQTHITDEVQASRPWKVVLVRSKDEKGRYRFARDADGEILLNKKTGRRIRLFEPILPGQGPVLSEQSRVMIQEAQYSINYGESSMATSILPDFLAIGTAEEIRARIEQGLPAVFFPKLTQDFETPNMSLREQIEMMDRSIKEVTGGKYGFSDVFTDVILSEISPATKNIVDYFLNESLKKFRSEEVQASLRLKQEKIGKAFPLPPLTITPEDEKYFRGKGIRITYISNFDINSKGKLIYQRKELYKTLHMIAVREALLGLIPDQAVRDRFRERFVGSTRERAIRGEVFWPISDWHDIFKAMVSHRAADQNETVTFVFDKGLPTQRVFAVEVPVLSGLSEPLQRIVGEYLATFVYNPLVTLGAVSLTIHANQATYGLIQNSLKESGQSLFYPYLGAYHDKRFRALHDPRSYSASPVTEPENIPAAVNVPAKGVFVGLAIGEQGFDMVLIRDGKRVPGSESQRDWTPSGFEQSRQFVESIGDAIERYLEDQAVSRAEVEAIGISWPTLISRDGRIVGTIGTMFKHFQGLPLREFRDEIGFLQQKISKSLDKPVVFRKDGDAAAAFHLATGKGSESHGTLFFGMGKRLATSYIDSEGRISPIIGEMGNMVIDMNVDAARHSFTQVKGVLQQTLSEPALLRLAKDSLMGDLKPGTVAGELGASYEIAISGDEDKKIDGNKEALAKLPLYVEELIFKDPNSMTPDEKDVFDKIILDTARQFADRIQKLKIIYNATSILLPSQTFALDKHGEVTLNGNLGEPAIRLIAVEAEKILRQKDDKSRVFLAEDLNLDKFLEEWRDEDPEAQRVVQNISKFLAEAAVESQHYLPDLQKVVIEGDMILPGLGEAIAERTNQILAQNGKQIHVGSITGFGPTERAQGAAYLAATAGARLASSNFPTGQVLPNIVALYWKTRDLYVATDHPAQADIDRRRAEMVLDAKNYLSERGIKEGRVLEFASGTGPLTLKLASLERVSEIVVVDISNAALLRLREDEAKLHAKAAAENTHMAKITVIEGDVYSEEVQQRLRDLFSGPQAADVAAIDDAFMHFSSPPNLVDSAHTRLKPGGLLLFNTVSVEGNEKRWKFLWNFKVGRAFYRLSRLFPFLMTWSTNQRWLILWIGDVLRLRTYPFTRSEIFGILTGSGLFKVLKLRHDASDFCDYYVVAAIKRDGARLASNPMQRIRDGISLLTSYKTLQFVELAVNHPDAFVKYDDLSQDNILELMRAFDTGSLEELNQLLSNIPMFGLNWLHGRVARQISNLAANKAEYLVKGSIMERIIFAVKKVQRREVLSMMSDRILGVSHTVSDSTDDQFGSLDADSQTLLLHAREFADLMLLIPEGRQERYLNSFRRVLRDREKQLKLTPRKTRVGAPGARLATDRIQVQVTQRMSDPILGEIPKVAALSVEIENTRRELFIHLLGAQVLETQAPDRTVRLSYTLSPAASGMVTFSFQVDKQGRVMQDTFELPGTQKPTDLEARILRWTQRQVWKADVFSEIVLAREAIQTLLVSPEFRSLVGVDEQAFDIEEVLRPFSARAQAAAIEQARVDLTQEEFLLSSGLKGSEGTSFRIALEFVASVVDSHGARLSDSVKRAAPIGLLRATPVVARFLDSLAPEPSQAILVPSNAPGGLPFGLNGEAFARLLEGVALAFENELSLSEEKDITLLVGEDTLLRFGLRYDKAARTIQPVNPALFAKPFVIKVGDVREDKEGNVMEAKVSVADLWMLIRSRDESVRMELGEELLLANTDQGVTILMDSAVFGNSIDQDSSLFDLAVIKFLFEAQRPERKNVVALLTDPAAQTRLGELKVKFPRLSGKIDKLFVSAAPEGYKTVLLTIPERAKLVSSDFLVAQNAPDPGELYAPNFEVPITAARTVEEDKELEPGLVRAFEVLKGSPVQDRKKLKSVFLNKAAISIIREYVLRPVAALKLGELFQSVRNMVQSMATSA